MSTNVPTIISTVAEDVQAAGSDTRPPMLDRTETMTLGLNESDCTVLERKMESTFSNPLMKDHIELRRLETYLILMKMVLLFTEWTDL